MTATQVQTLQRIVWKHYRALGRHDLPWRATKNPYRILVSEVMLQQTQVARVRVKYRSFISRFPTVAALARAPLRDVLIAWQGLGYNRRAKMLHDAAKAIVTHYRGRVPRAYHTLTTLPGIGPYTAGAICAFAYNQAVPLVETNIRTVLFYHVLPHRREVSDRELLRLVEVSMDTTQPREWYWALMDYGSWLKGEGVRNNSVSKHHVTQSKFKGSDREVRGALLKALAAARRPRTTNTLVNETAFARPRIVTQLENLVREGLVTKQGSKWSV